MLPILFVALGLAASALGYPTAIPSGGECPMKFKRQTPTKPPATFDAAAQAVNVTGANAFVPPTSTDLRGPCPGLNSLANHGYIARNGLTNLLEAVSATNKVFGMGLDLGTFLSTVAVLLDGNPVTTQWSIGGPPSLDLTNLLITQPQGLSGSHNKYETDASPVRGDYNTHNGDVSTPQLDQFMALYQRVQANGGKEDYNLDVFTEHAKYTYNKSVSENPYFFYGPFTGACVSMAAHTFPPAYMSNHSAEFPQGILNRQVLKSFYSFTESADGKLQPVVGHERIPDNWYRRPVATPYGLAELVEDIVRVDKKAPERFALGGNTGQVNSFKGLSSADGGASPNLFANGSNPLCFGAQLLTQAVPDILKGIVNDVAAVIGLINKNLGDTIQTLGCPAAAPFDITQVKQFPGAGYGL